MKEIIKKGKTVEEAVDAALLELGVTRDEVLIDVISEGTKGIFGLGSKEAEVCVKLEEAVEESADEFSLEDNNENSNEDKARAFLSRVLEGLNLTAQLDIKTEDETMNINVSGEDMGVIIGRRGETLTALQYLTSLVVNRKADSFTRISLDTENYRKRREEALEKLANKTADKVVKYRRSMTLDPMNPYERRIVHSCLQANEQVSTYSTGDEPYRRVVIALKRN